MKKALFFILFSLFVHVSVSAQPYARFHEGLLKNTQVKGWILQFLERQQTGLTGHPEAMSYPYNSCLWAGNITREAEDRGSDWWRYEQTAYYTDGLLRLGYLLNDQSLINKGKDGVYYTIEHATENGKLGHADIESLWPFAVFFRAMLAEYQATGDERIVSSLEKHYLNFTAEEIAEIRNLINVEGILWVYGKTKNKKLLDLAEEAFKLEKSELTREVVYNDENPHIHGVTYAETMKIPLILYAYTGKKEYLDFALRANKKVEDMDMLPDGVPTSAEYLLGNDFMISHETCDITDFSWSWGYFLETTGEAHWADLIEKAVFNAGPGAVTKDFKALQYFSSVNQFIATGTSNHNEFKNGSTWMAYRPIHETECCAGNVHRFMPNYASRMWMVGDKDELVSALYGPSAIDFKLSNGRNCHVEEVTNYPFDETIIFNFKMSKSSKMKFTLRIPEWCESASITINDKPYKEKIKYGEYMTIERKFSSDDQIVLKLDMPIKIKKTADKKGTYFERGPLLYSYSIGMTLTEDLKEYENMATKKVGNPDFKCWDIRPLGKFNYALTPESRPKFVRRIPNSNYPFDWNGAPVSIIVPVREIDWELEDDRFTPTLPDSVVYTKDETNSIVLVPYGCTMLRLTVFPTGEASKVDETKH